MHSKHAESVNIWRQSEQPIRKSDRTPVCSLKGSINRVSNVEQHSGLNYWISFRHAELFILKDNISWQLKVFLEGVNSKVLWEEGPSKRSARIFWFKILCQWWSLKLPLTTASPKIEAGRLHTLEKLQKERRREKKGKIMCVFYSYQPWWYKCL